MLIHLIRQKVEFLFSCFISKNQNSQYQTLHLNQKRYIQTLSLEHTTDSCKGNYTYINSNPEMITSILFWFIINKN